MKKVAVFLLLGLGAVSNAFAGGRVGFSTMQINWAPAKPEVVPTMGTYAMLALALLLSVVVYRALRERAAWIKAIAPVVTFGLAGSLVLVAGKIDAGASSAPVDAGSCSGSSTYTAGEFPPPCFINSCGQPVVVTYDVLGGESYEGIPLTAENCTFNYYCSEGGFEGPNATQGSTVPSDGNSYGTAFCDEIFGAGEL